MSTATEASATYVSQATNPPATNEAVQSFSMVKGVEVDIEQVPAVSSQAGLVSNTKMIVAASVVIGFAIAATICVPLVVTLVALRTRTTTTLTTTTATTTTAMPAPSNMVSYRGNNGQSYVFSITGSTSGTIYGTTIYTDDSDLAVAAVHSGFVPNNQVRTITVMVLAGQSSYTSTTQNGVTSLSYVSWSGSYSIISSSG